jgi:transketolase
MPNLHVFRPADANETAAAWRAAMERTAGPTAIVLTRQKIPVLDPEKVTRDGGVLRGGYVVEEADGGKPDVLLLASGSEVSVALAARKLLAGEGIRARVVSMPCWERFEEQPAKYRDSVLPPDVPARVSVEAGATFGWERYVGTWGASVGIDRFGASAPAERLFREFRITPEAVRDRAKSLTGARKGGGWT